jgi:hypothetical protein
MQTSEQTSFRQAWLMPKIVIRNNDSGKVIRILDGDTLRNLNMRGMDLRRAAMYAIEVLDGKPVENPIAAFSFRKADVSGGDFSGADLSGAVFSEETVVRANFTDANLLGAVLVRSHFVSCRFTGTNLSNACLMNTCFTDCGSLHRAKGLDAVEHAGPSILDARTLRSSIAKLPLGFLLGAGFTEQEVLAFRTLYDRERVFYSCFISYARANHEFADYLRRRLLKSNISCWQDTHDMRGGNPWRGQIYDAIEKHDKLVLVCSKDSLTRPAVVEEILEAIDRERKTNTQKLFPLRLDDYIFSDELEEVARTAVARGEWKENWVAYVRAYHIPDLSNWKKPRNFAREFSKLVEALKKPAKR